MKFYIQSSLEHPYGNCWQTAVACILDVEPGELPSQATYHTSYLNQLNAYLEKHHDKMYTCLHSEYLWRSVLHAYGKHPEGHYCWEGPTVRTPVHGADHVVVARGDKMVWDVHPSGAGLTQVKRWGLIGPIPDDIRAWRGKMREKGDKDVDCVCPKCKGG